MNLFSNDLIFFTYSSIGASFAGFAILFGTPAKIRGAGVLLLSIFCSNIAYGLFYRGNPSSQGLTIVNLTYDTVATCVFACYARHGTAIEPRRWAVWVALCEMLSTTADLVGLLQQPYSHSREYHVLINVLLLASYAGCFVAVIPKSGAEARAVLATKYIYVKADMLDFFDRMRRINDGR